jgi:hypothetical protein
MDAGIVDGGSIRGRSTSPKLKLDALPDRLLTLPGARRNVKRRRVAGRGPMQSSFSRRSARRFASLSPRCGHRVWRF